MTMKMISVTGSAIEELPEGCKKVKFQNASGTPVFVTFGDGGVLGSDQGNRVDAGELELDVPKGATHMALKALAPTFIGVDAGEAAHGAHAKSHANEDHPPAKKK